MELDQTFWTGFAAVVSAIIVFCGSVWLVLGIVLGNKLAYFVTASITLAFLFIMTLVWSFTQLGPVGELPEFRPQAVASPDEVDFGAASSYPEGPWTETDPDDQAQVTKAAEAETAALDAVAQAIEAGDVTEFETIDQAAVVSESTRFVTQDDTEYAATLVGPTDEEIEPSNPEGAVMVVSRYDPGNPLGLARTISLGTFVVLVVHLFFLSRSERKARALAEQTA
jgi:hypothetical protein